MPVCFTCQQFGHNSVNIGLRMFSLVLQMCFGMSVMYSKFGIDTFDTVPNLSNSQNSKIKKEHNFKKYGFQIKKKLSQVILARHQTEDS